MNLDKLFKPKTIAIIGASDKKGNIGAALMKNLTGSDYNGIVYPVSDKRKEVFSIKCYATIADVPEKIDLVIIAIPAESVPQVVLECGKAGVSSLIIISAGFSEIGKTGEILSKKIVKIAKKYSMRVLGPNCLGFINPSLNLNASFAKQTAKKGHVALISQSGALCTAILDWGEKNNVGFSYFVSIGEMADIGFHDLIDYFGKDPNVSSILIYMESISDVRKFMSAARAFSNSKPIIVLKSGRSAAGAAAAKSHTGSLTGNDKVYNAAFKRAGIIRVDTIVNLFHVAKTLAMQPRPAGANLGIVTNAGGPGIIAVDALVRGGGHSAKLAKETILKLDKFLPHAWSRGNPIDILGDADSKRYRQAMEICLDDKNTDAVLVILTPQAMTDPIVVAKEILKIKNKSNKTILAAWMGGNNVEKGRKILEAGNIPIYRAPEDAISCFVSINNYARNLSMLNEMPGTVPHAINPKTKENKEIVAKVFLSGREVLTESETKQFLKNYDIPIVKSLIAKSKKESGKVSEKIGYPVVMKIASADIVHKTNIGGVELNINSNREAGDAWKKIMSAAKKNCPEAKIEGVAIEKMISKKYELIIGCRKDPLFGPVIVFGLGGVAVEVFNDIEMGLPPLNMSLALRMIQGTKVYRLLKGYRNMPGVDIQSIQFLLYKFAYLISDFPEIAELDINPFAVDENGGVVLDAKVILDKNMIGKKIKPYSHLVILPHPKSTRKTKLKK
ncbi:MAG: acetate--CoA ligase alpha subunit [bacterium]